MDRRQLQDDANIGFNQMHRCEIRGKAIQCH